MPARSSILSPSRWPSWLRSKPAAVLGIIVPLALGYALFLWSLPPQKLFSVLTADTETVIFAVVNPDQAAFRIAGARLRRIDGAEPRCVEGIVTPSQDARVQYRRAEAEGIGIAIDPAPGALKAPTASLRADDSAPDLIEGPLILFADGTCSGRFPTRLPIWGSAQFGSELRVSAEGEAGRGMLFKGKLAIYGHAHERLLFLRMAPGLYPVSSIDLPAGARVTVLGADEKEAPVPWWGVARVQAEATGFLVEASTEARSIALFMPGPGVTPVNLGGFAQLIKDPNVIQIQIVIAALIVIVQASGSLIRLGTNVEEFRRSWRRRRAETRTRKSRKVRG